jgi:acyl-CoA thioester hydrolase
MEDWRNSPWILGSVILFLTLSLVPAFAGEQIEIRTWVENVRRVRSLRKYEFVRNSDGRILVKGETDWVFVDMKTGRPQAIPEEVSRVFELKKS